MHSGRGQSCILPFLSPLASNPVAASAVTILRVNCTFRKTIVEYVAKSLEPAVTAKVDRHRAVCADCRAEIDTLARERQAFMKEFPFESLDMPQGYSPSILRKEEAQVKGHEKKNPYLPWHSLVGRELSGWIDPRRRG